MKIIVLSFLLAILVNIKSWTQPWQEHGPLKVSENGHFLEHEDGSSFFWLGCTAWMLARLAPAEVDKYLEDRAKKGFSVIQFTANNMGRVNYNGEWPFIGKGRPWNEVVLNESYWEHIDYIIEKAKEYSLFVAVFVWWGSDANDPNRKKGNSTRQHFTDPDRHNYEFGQLLGARYNQQPHIIWVGAGEYHKPVSAMFPKRQSIMSDEHRRRLVNVIRGIKANDGGHHLYSIHPISFLSSSEDFHEATWLDFNMIQTHAVAEFVIPLTLADWKKKPTKPTFNAEGWYENEQDLFERWTDMTKAGDLSFDADWIQRYQAYWSVFAGGFGFTYGHKNLWRMESDNGEPGVLQQDVLDAPGASSLIHLRSLIESKPIQTRIPDPQLVTSGTTGRDGGLSPDRRIGTRAEDGSWAFVYSTWGSLINVNMDRMRKGEVIAYWYNPRNGKWHVNGVESFKKINFQKNIPSGAGAPQQYFDPPGKSGDGNDWVLVLEVD